MGKGPNLRHHGIKRRTVSHPPKLHFLFGVGVGVHQRPRKGSKVFVEDSVALAGKKV